MRAGHRLHQVIAAATPGDAVTGQALRWRDRLRAWGCASEIVAEHVHPALEGDVLRLDRAGGGALAAADGILIHYSIWSRVVEAALAAAAPLGVIYHNVTPGISPTSHHRLTWARRRWWSLPQGCDRA